MSQKLTPKLIRKLFPEQNSKEIERLNVSAKDIVEVGDLTTCPSLIRLDLSLNNIQDTNFATTCQQIKWLSLANNPIADVGPLQCLTNLQVLNVGHAKLAGKIRIQGLDQLGALILNDNQITSISGLKRLPNLNTLVLKQNAFKELGTSLHKCGGLQKLSMAHNQLSSIGDALSHCTALKELRLNHNAIDLLPAELAANSQLRILDLGDNPIADTDALKVLAALPWLRNLNLKSCGVSQTDDYPQSILRMLPNLDVLDNKRVAAERSKQPKAALQIPSTAEVAAAQHTAEAARQHATQPAAGMPDRKDRTKSASTSAGGAGLSANVGKDRAAGKSRDKKMPVSEAEARDGTQAKQKKKRGVPEQEMQDVGEQTCMRDGAAEKDSVGARKKQRLQDEERGPRKETAAVTKASGDKTPGKSSVTEQGGLPDTRAPHRPAMVGVFEAHPDAGDRKQQKVTALARGAQAAALLAAEPEALGTATGWSWEAPAPGAATDPGMSTDKHNGKAGQKTSAKPEQAIIRPEAVVRLPKSKKAKSKKAKQGAA